MRILYNIYIYIEICVCVYVEIGKDIQYRKIESQTILMWDYLDEHVCVCVVFWGLTSDFDHQEAAHVPFNFFSFRHGWKMGEIGIEIGPKERPWLQLFSAGRFFQHWWLGWFRSPCSFRTWQVFSPVFAKVLHCLMFPCPQCKNTNLCQNLQSTLTHTHTHMYILYIYVYRCI